MGDLVKQKLSNLSDIASLWNENVFIKIGNIMRGVIYRLGTGYVIATEYLLPSYPYHNDIIDRMWDESSN